MHHLVYLIALFPLIGFLINGLFRNSLPKSMSGLIGSSSVLISFAMSVGLFFQVKLHGALPIEPLFTFIKTDSFRIDFAFQADQLSCLFLLIITGVGYLIHLYSTSYMHDEEAPHFARYFAYLNLFVFSMLVLVLGSGFVIMFIGWEGVGLCSYLLIGYWFKNSDYNYAARKAFVMNRIGDLGFLLAVFWLLARVGASDYHTVFASLGKLTQADITGITLLLFVGAAGKSAQIPLYTWLPDAMAGPTPVSALIHAATMVTAGIYMIVRSNALYSLAPFTNEIIALIGLATALLAASIALKQNDIKKVLAYSTVSQLGYMFLGLGVGAYTGAVFHVMTHAFFKALLFLGAGSVIHALGGEQDLRKMGGLRAAMPITHLTFLLACFAIAGVPPFSGFFSKDEILAAAYRHNPVYFYLGVAGSLMTAFYMFRLYALAFRGGFRGTEDQQHHLHESPAAITVPLAILAVLAVFGGFLGIPEAIAPDSHVLEKFLEPVIPAVRFHFGPVPPPVDRGTDLLLMFGVAALVIVMIVWAWKKYSSNEAASRESDQGVLAHKWYVDELYNAVIVNPVLKLSDFLKNIVERLGIDGLVNGTGRFVNYSARQMRLLQSGQVGGYILFMVLSLIVLFLVFWNQDLIVNFLQKIV